MSSDGATSTPSRMRRELAGRGLFKVGVPPRLGGLGGDLRDVVHAVAATARSCPASAVLLASQRLLVEVLLRAGNIGLMEYRLPGLLDGDLGGNCAAAWPPGDTVTPAVAHDTGRGWRLSGRLPALPNLGGDGFLVSVPVSFDGTGPYALVLVDGEEDGVAQHPVALDHGQEGAGGVSLELKNVFLREDEMLHGHGAEVRAGLIGLVQASRAAIVAGHCHRLLGGEADRASLSACVERHLVEAAQAVLSGRDVSASLIALQRLRAGLDVGTRATALDASVVIGRPVG